MSKKRICLVILSYIITLCAGYIAGQICSNSFQSKPSSGNSNEISRLIDFTRNYLIRERADIDRERSLAAAEREQLTADRNAFNRERSLFESQRGLSNTDRKDLTDLSGILEEIRVLAQSKE